SGLPGRRLGVLDGNGAAGNRLVPDWTSGPRGPRGGLPRTNSEPERRLLWKLRGGSRLPSEGGDQLGSQVLHRRPAAARRSGVGKGRPGTKRGNRPRMKERSG